MLEELAQPADRGPFPMCAELNILRAVLGRQVLAPLSSEHEPAPLPSSAADPALLQDLTSKGPVLVLAERPPCEDLLLGQNPSLENQADDFADELSIDRHAGSRRW